MSFFESVQRFFDIVWTSCADFPILNTGLVFKDIFFGLIGLSVLGFLLSRLFSFSSGANYRVGSRSDREDISSERRSDWR